MSSRRKDSFGQAGRSRTGSVVVHRGVNGVDWFQIRWTDNKHKRQFRALGSSRQGWTQALARDAVDAIIRDLERDRIAAMRRTAAAANMNRPENATYQHIRKGATAAQSMLEVAETRERQAVAREILSAFHAAEDAFGAYLRCPSTEMRSASAEVRLRVAS